MPRKHLREFIAVLLRELNSDAILVGFGETLDRTGYELHLEIPGKLRRSLRLSRRLADNALANRKANRSVRTALQAVLRVRERWTSGESPGAAAPPPLLSPISPDEPVRSEAGVDRHAGHPGEATPPARVPRKTPARVALDAPPERFWAIVLAGGDGVRLRQLIRYVCGDERPKQYAPLVGSRSLLRQTLDRVALAIAPERTVVVAHQRHTAYLAEEVRTSPRQVLVQPADRGTAAGILLAAHWISWRAPEALVAVFPSDHFVLPEVAFMAHVAGLGGFVHRHPERLVLLGATPTDPEPEYGWIEPGEVIGWAAKAPVFAVHRFRESPSAAESLAFYAQGAMWNTLVLVTTVTTLVEAGCLALPALSDRLARIEPFADTAEEAQALHHAYALSSSADFSQVILEPCPPCLAVSRLPPGITWADLGVPERVIKSLRAAGITPRWLPALDRKAGLSGADLPWAR